MAKLATLPTPFTAPETGFEPLPIPGLEALLYNGLPRGILAEVNGARSSGRSAVCLHFLAQATQRGEICAFIDLNDTFYPAWAAAAGVALERIVWVRCGGQAGNAMRAADLLLHAGGFGMVLLDICEANARVLNRIPLSYWYRFRRAVENTPSIFVLCADTHQARSASVTIEMRSRRVRWLGKAPFRVIQSLESAAVSQSAAVPPASLSIRSVA